MLSLISIVFFSYYIELFSIISFFNYFLVFFSINVEKMCEEPLLAFVSRLRNYKLRTWYPWGGLIESTRIIPFSGEIKVAVRWRREVIVIEFGSLPCGWCSLLAWLCQDVIESLCGSIIKYHYPVLLLVQYFAGIFVYLFIYLLFRFSCFIILLCIMIRTPRKYNVKQIRRTMRNKM